MEWSVAIGWIGIAGSLGSATALLYPLFRLARRTRDRRNEDEYRRRLSVDTKTLNDFNSSLEDIKRKLEAKLGGRERVIDDLVRVVEFLLQGGSLNRERLSRLEPSQRRLMGEVAFYLAVLPSQGEHSQAIDKSSLAQLSLALFKLGEEMETAGSSVYDENTLAFLPRYNASLPDYPHARTIRDVLKRKRLLT